MFKVTFNDLVIIAMEIHLFPCRTQKLSPSTAEVLGGCPLGDRRVAKFWEFSSAGRASALQAEGQRLSRRPVTAKIAGSIPVRTVSRNTNDSLAQLVEHLTFNQRVAGSSPARVIILADVAELADALDLGSSA